MWYEDDGFWRDGYELMFSPEAFRRAEEDVPRILTLAGHTLHDVLDLCCGPGRHTIPLATQGLQVTALDLSPLLLERARAHASAAGVTPEFVQADIRMFIRPAAFDLALNLSNSFGYFPESADDDRVRANVFASLRRGGCLVIDLRGKELMTRGWGDRVIDLDDGSVCTQRVHIINEWAALRSEWIFATRDHVRRYELTHRIYSGLELRALMERAGFEVSLFGDFDGRPYGPEATRLVAVGRKR